jgi:hypothetical protein
LVIGNKKDLLTDEEIEAVKTKATAKIDLITSAKENANVEEAFLELTQQSLK